MADNTSTVFLVGLIVFFASSFGVLLTYFYYIIRGRKLQAKYKCNEEVCIRWNLTRWIYPIVFISLALIAILYLSMYLGQGISIKPNLLRVMWERWAILAIVAFLYSVCLTCIMTARANDEQSFFLVFLYVIAYSALIAAVLSQAYQTRLMWATLSMVAFVLAILFYVYPNNRFDSRYHTVSNFSYHYAFIVALILHYITNIVIYFLAASNEYTNVLNFHGESIAYLVGDILFVVLFAVVLIIATFVNLKDTLKVVNPKTGQTIYASKL